MASKRETLEIVDVDVASLHNPVRRLLKDEYCFGDLLDSNIEMCQSSQTERMRDHCCKTASRRTCVDDNIQPLIMTWSKMAPKGTKMAKVS
jgi:hypothetical protein